MAGAKRTTGGKFAPGTSGNPRGRPKSKTAALKAALEKDGAAVAKKVVDQAKAGDMQACRIVLERLVPAFRPASQTVQFDFDPSAPMADQARQILAAVSHGELPPDQGRALIDGLAAVGKIVEIEELVRRQEEIERLLKEQQERWKR
ncbi:MAG: DUF5681 domain-containing protein [Vreelandella alkaliphila]|uniref:DUF5681 domain-containing protein n=1 Tax=Halomonas campaniensis TaxID=213554 RepID=A0A3D0KIC7_9GAMM|nr:MULTISPECIES: DUF5681 domain-containing protein [unclassified Halomonas]HBP41916.1 hypothetical protein [Halomonas sp.]HBS82363.1 hypothetical protein [Halomonas campaniensis]HCA03268.1 hypothetical protein [Halomonas campaniensis]